MRTRMIAPLLLALQLLVGCATNQSKTTGVADRLESAADTFAGRTCHEPDAACSSDSYLQLVHGLSDDAHEFRETLQAGASGRDVLLAYERLWRRYHALRYEVARSDDRALQADWSAVTAAFVDVQQHVKARYSDADPALYGRGGYTLDPYYN
jgi:hypothetical protein